MPVLRPRHRKPPADPDRRLPTDRPAAASRGSGRRDGPGNRRLQGLRESRRLEKGGGRQAEDAEGPG